MVNALVPHIGHHKRYRRRHSLSANLSKMPHYALQKWMCAHLVAQCANKLEKMTVKF